MSELILPKIDKSTILNKLKLKKKEFFLVSAHREENIDIETKNFLNNIKKDTFLEDNLYNFHYNYSINLVTDINY